MNRVKPLPTRRDDDKRDLETNELPPVLLTGGDWEEIYYALESKIHYIRDGLRSGKGQECDEEDLISKRWINHLNEIIHKIGPDGIEAAKKGTITILRGGKPL
jgi:hypothetical protein